MPCCPNRTPGSRRVPDTARPPAPADAPARLQEPGNTAPSAAVAQGGHRHAAATQGSCVLPVPPAPGKEDTPVTAGLPGAASAAVAAMPPGAAPVPVPVPPVTPQPAGMAGPAVPVTAALQQPAPSPAPTEGGIARYARSRDGGGAPAMPGKPDIPAAAEPPGAASVHTPDQPSPPGGGTVPGARYERPRDGAAAAPAPRRRVFEAPEGIFNLDYVSAGEALSVGGLVREGKAELTGKVTYHARSGLCSLSYRYIRQGGHV